MANLRFVIEDFLLPLRRLRMDEGPHRTRPPPWPRERPGATGTSVVGHAGTGDPLAHSSRTHHAESAAARAASAAAATIARSAAAAAATAAAAAAAAAADATAACSAAARAQRHRVARRGSATHQRHRQLATPSAALGGAATATHRQPQYRRRVQYAGDWYIRACIAVTDGGGHGSRRAGGGARTVPMHSTVMKSYSRAGRLSSDA